LFIALITVVGLACFAAFAYALFVRQQDAQFSEILARDLTRAQELFRSPLANMGLPLVENEESYILQFVSPDNQVVLPLDSGEALPHHTEPSQIQVGRTTFLVQALPWYSPNGDVRGSIRLAIDFSDALAARGVLLRSMLVSGGVIALLALVTGLWLVQRALRPLTQLAKQARAVDPAHPALTSYQGPADEVADLAHALNATLAGIRERQEAERASLAEIAHELAAPLTLVAAHLNALEPPQTAKHHVSTTVLELMEHPIIHNPADLRAAKDAANELLYTSQDLLTLARGELERPLTMEIFSLPKVIKRIAREYPDVTVDIGEGAHDSELAGSPRHLTQLVRNLVRNAVQASRGKPVTITLKKHHSTLLLEVRDQGVGVPPEDIPHLFERFYSRSHGGTGLGLSVVKRVAEQHGGQVEVESHVGKGTCMRVKLPDLLAQLEDV
jgi:signal transduction histidine kinase